MKKLFASGVCFAAAAMLCLPAALNAAEQELKVGDKVPQFTAKDDSGKAWKSSEHVGKRVVVVFFFPAALTGG